MVSLFSWIFYKNEGGYVALCGWGLTLPCAWTPPHSLRCCWLISEQAADGLGRDFRTPSSLNISRREAAGEGGERSQTLLRQLTPSSDLREPPQTCHLEAQTTGGAAPDAAAAKINQREMRARGGGDDNSCLHLLCPRRKGRRGAAGASRESTAAPASAPARQKASVLHLPSASSLLSSSSLS